MGDALGKLYVERHFPPGAKARMDELVANLREAYRVSINQLDWMTPDTRQRALAKLDDRRSSASMRLARLVLLGDLGGTDPAQARHPVGLTPALELVEARQLGLVGRDDQLAGALVGDFAVVAVGVELARSFDAEPRSQRSWSVVDAGVDDAARVAGLVRAKLRLALENADSRIGVPLGQLARDREPDDAPTDDREVTFARRLDRRHSSEASAR